jgi:hypothetical protein
MNRQDWLDLVNPAVLIVVKKGEDYNHGPKLEDYFPFGDFSYIQMIHLKALRLVSLVDKVEVNFEGKKDTIYDLINYCVFYLKFLKELEYEKF